MSYTSTGGDVLEVEYPRNEVNRLMALLCSEKQNFIRRERDEIENKKSLQSVAKADLVMVKIPELSITTSKNNICEWIEATYQKFKLVKKHNPSHIMSVILTIIDKSGPIQPSIKFKKNIDDIYSTLVTMYLQGTQGIEMLYEMKNMIRSNSCLDSRQCVRNIEVFEQKTKIIQKMGILKNVSASVVKNISEWLFLNGDMMDWHKRKARNLLGVLDGPSGLDKIYERNKSMMLDPNFSVIEESDDSDDEADSELNNTVLRAKRGLATGSINAPFQDMLQLIAFIPSVKRKHMTLSSVYTDVDFKEQAMRESRLKNININERNVSFKTQSQGISGNNVIGSKARGEAFHWWN